MKSGFLMIVPIYAKVSKYKKLILYHKINIWSLIILTFFAFASVFDISSAKTVYNICHCITPSFYSLNIIYIYDFLLYFRSIQTHVFLHLDVILYMWYCICDIVYVILYMWYCICDIVYVILYMWYCICDIVYVVLSEWEIV